MCASVYFDGRAIWTIGALKALVDPEKIVVSEDYDRADVIGDDDCCLCAIDLVATADGAGFRRIEEDDPLNDPMEHRWEKLA